MTGTDANKSVCVKRRNTICARTKCVRIGNDYNVSNRPSRSMIVPEVFWNVSPKNLCTHLILRNVSMTLNSVNMNVSFSSRTILQNQHLLLRSTVFSSIQFQRTNLYLENRLFINKNIRLDLVNISASILFNNKNKISDLVNILTCILFNKNKRLNLVNISASILFNKNKRFIFSIFQHGSFFQQE